MFTDIGLALGQILDSRFRGVLIRALLLTLVLLFATNILFLTGLGILLPDTMTLPWIGEVTYIDSVISVGAFLLMVPLSIILMFPVASVFVGFFLDEIAGAVETRHYPELAVVRPQPLAEILVDALRFLGIMVLANLLLLIVYFLSAVFAPLIFLSVNGYLLGREYFQLVALRRLPLSEANALRKRNRGVIWVTGVLMAVPLMVPFLNLLVPILGVAVYTHQFHRLHRG